MSIAVLTILAPIGAAVLALGLRRWPGAIVLAGGLLALIAAIVTLARVADGERFTSTLPGLPNLPLRLAVDPLTATLTTVVAVVSMFVLVYTVGYMADEDDQGRFFAGMAFFVAAMQMLILAGDWILLLAAWELIGLASYLLIGFWFTRTAVGPAATQAFMVTRSADIGLYIGVIIIIADTGTTAIHMVSQMNGTPAILAGIALLVAAVGKSAQAPLQGWLLDAMVGPTPVSALLHAATLVVAGVILLIRAFPLMSSEVLLVIGVVGGLSSILAGLTAVAQPDLKRLLAASTSSQLGLMFLALGAGSVPAAMFHLVTHAAMKSALFLAAGVFQHDRHSTAFDEVSGAGRQRPATFAVFIIAGLALAGIPPLAGFWSKDAVIAATLHAQFARVLSPLVLIATALTGLYIGRAARLLWGDDHARQEAPVNGHSIIWMGTGLIILAILASGLGLSMEPLAQLFDDEIPEDPTGLVVGLMVAIVGLLIGWRTTAPRLLGAVYSTAQDGFRFKDGWAGSIARPTLILGARFDQLDQVIHAGVHGVGRRALEIASSSRTLDERVHGSVEGVGSTSMAVARSSHAFDQKELDGFIAGLVHLVWNYGQLARRLQTGLVHRELLVAMGGAALVLVLTLID